MQRGDALTVALVVIDELGVHDLLDRAWREAGI